MSYSDDVLALSPVAYWRLGESSGTIAVDEVGSYDGTYVNTPTLGEGGLLAGDGDTSIITDGISSYVNLNSALPTLQNYSTGAVSFIFKLNSSGDSAIVTSADDSTNDTYMILGVTESRCEFYYKYDGVGLGLDNFARTADVTLDLNTIYHVVFVQDDTVGVRIYLGGIELTTYTRQGIANAKWWNSASSLTDTLSLNALIRESDIYYASNIDEVAIFPTALTQEQVTTLYKSSLGFGNAFDIVIDHTKVAEDLYDFPLLVNLGAESGIEDFDSTDIFSELAINPNLLLMLTSDQLISNGIIVDSSIYNTDISNTNTVHSQVVKKIGESSLLFNGSSHLSGNLHTALGDDDFTIDFWYYTVSNANNMIMSVGSAGTNRLALQNYNGNVYFYNGSLSYTSLSADFVPYTWMHVAIVRFGGNIKVYFGGIEVHSAVTPFTGNETNIGIGSSGGTVAFLHGNIDEFRIIKEAVWLSDFTPEVVHYTTDSLKTINAVYINPADTIEDPISVSNAMVWVGTTQGGNDLGVVTGLSSSGAYTLTFTATTTSSYLRIGNASGNINASNLFDNISVKQSNLVTNGTFDSDLSNWIDANSHWAWVSGRAYHASSSTFNTLRILLNLEIGETYSVTFDVEHVSGGQYRCQSRDISNNPTTDFRISNDTTDTHTFAFTASEADIYIAFARDDSGIASEFYIDNVVIESNNLVTNGTFDTDTSGWVAGNGAGLSVNLVNQLEVTNNISSTGYASQELTTTVGDNYELSFEWEKVDGNTPSDATIYSRQCKVEIDRWDQVNQQAQLWVKVPYISKDVDTTINLSFDLENDDNSDNIGETGEIPAQAVWEDYFGVWHQSFDGADSTINANHGTLINMDDSNIVDFGVGKGLSFNGIDESITLPDLNHGSLNQFSLSVTAMSNDITTQASIIDLNNSTETSDPNVQVNINQGNVSNEIMYYTRHNATNQQHNENSDVTVSNTFDLVSTENSDMDAFLNGQDLSSVEVGVGDYVYSNDTLENKIGVHRLGAGFFEGNIKEIRLSKSIKSASYIATNYESTQDSLVRFSTAYSYLLAKNIFGSITEDVAVENWYVRAYLEADGTFIAQIQSVAGDFVLPIPVGSWKPMTVTVSPIMGTPWIAGVPTFVDTLIYPNDPETTPYYYICTVSGTGADGVTGVTEPAWPTTVGGTVVDGSVTWERVERMIQPITHSPMIPQ